MVHEKDHIEIFEQGVDTWNQWRAENPSISPILIGESLGGEVRSIDLSGANLSKARLSESEYEGSNFRKALLRHTDLHRTYFSESDFTEADLRHSNLIGAHLGGTKLNFANLAYARLREATLTNAQLLSANLSGVDLRSADLEFADFSNATMGGTIVDDVDLSSVKGLETIKHTAPSTIGIDAIYRSQGKIPEIFLRGAGVPENFITYIHSLAGNTFEYYSCFISYSTKDQEFAERLHADLQVKGVRCWFAPHDIQSGKKLHEQIDHAIRIHQKVLLIVSPDSMNSEWVETEIAKARKREMEEKKQVLFPIRLVDFDLIRRWECFDADTGKDSAREVREYFIPDFSNWTNQASYRTAFERLLKDLRGEEGKMVAAQ